MYCSNVLGQNSTNAILAVFELTIGQGEEGPEEHFSTLKQLRMLEKRGENHFWQNSTSAMFQGKTAQAPCIILIIILESIVYLLQIVSSPAILDTIELSKRYSRL